VICGNGESAKWVDDDELVECKSEDEPDEDGFNFFFKSLLFVLDFFEFLLLCFLGIIISRWIGGGSGGGGCGPFWFDFELIDDDFLIFWPFEL